MDIWGGKLSFNVIILSSKFKILKFRRKSGVFFSSVELWRKFRNCGNYLKNSKTLRLYKLNFFCKNIYFQPCSRGKIKVFLTCIVFKLDIYRSWTCFSETASGKEIEIFVLYLFIFDQFNSI